jgi:hypothetical protein
VLDRIAEQYPTSVAFIAIHTWWPGYDEFYADNVDENTDRIYYYGGSLYTPHLFIDGGDAGYTGPWEQWILDRLAAYSPLRIELTGNPADTSITATITNTSSGMVSGYLHFVITENGLIQAGHEDYVQNHAMRDFVPPNAVDLPDPPSDAAGEPIALTPGGVVVKTRHYTLAPPREWVEDNLECVVFVQNNSNKEIIQAAKIYFRLDEPELLTAGKTIADGTGDGDGRLDPGETADLSVVLANLNPADAVDVWATLESPDAYATISDDSGTWPNIPGGAQAENTADPFTLTADAGTPWGYEIPCTLRVTANTTYTEVFELEIGVGSPEHPIGPDAYGYYAYEDADDYVPSPTFDWVEIDPNLGGSGTLVSLGDDQVTNRTMPFNFRLYDYSSDRVAVCSNGFLVSGVSSYSSNANGELPGSGIGRMMAGFWTDLNPAAPGGGKIYEYSDATHHRYIIEFSGVEHYDDAGAGVPETFQFLLYDPAYWPTQTGDGELVLQYLTVNDPNSCTVGIQNSDRTIGTEYLALGELNVAAHGLAGGRAIKFTTTRPDGVIGVGDTSQPKVASLAAQPNPFRTGTTIAYRLPRAGMAAIRIFGLDGTLLRTLVEGPLPEGAGFVAWDGTDRYGTTLPPGVYLFRLTGDGVDVNGKVVRVR